MRVEWSPCGFFCSIFLPPGRIFPGQSAALDSVARSLSFAGFSARAIHLSRAFGHGTPGLVRFQTGPPVRSVGASGARGTQLAKAAAEAAC